MSAWRLTEEYIFMMNFGKICYESLSECYLEGHDLYTNLFPRLMRLVQKDGKVIRSSFSVSIFVDIADTSLAQIDEENILKEYPYALWKALNTSKTLWKTDNDRLAFMEGLTNGVFDNLEDLKKAYPGIL